MKKRIAIIGGCGHVGLPLGIALAETGFSITLLDINNATNQLVNKGIMPFLESDEASKALKKAIRNKKLIATNKITEIKHSSIVIFITGTPVDEHLNPRIHEIINIIKTHLPYLNSEQLLVLRSTIYPETLQIIDELLTKSLGKHKLAFCPERIVQSCGFSEIKKLPQIISATSKQAEKEAVALFSNLTSKIKILTPLEAALAKLLTNSWRYIEFAIANQFYMMLEAQGLDFYKIYDALKFEYPRAAHFASPGLTAGPCLFKDTMQLSAFHKNNFFLGHSAMLVNEGLPLFLTEQMQHLLGDLKNRKIAILGMAFKADSDDKRESLSCKLKKTLETKMAIVLPSDVYDKNTLDFKEAIRQAEGIILGVPHKEYLDLKINKPFIDCWGVWKKRDIK